MWFVALEVVCPYALEEAMEVDMEEWGGQIEVEVVSHGASMEEDMEEWGGQIESAVVSHGAWRS